MTRKRAMAPHPGALIRERLTANGMSQADLARKTGLTQKHVSRVVTGQSGVGADAAIAIAHALDIEASALLRMQADWDSASHYR